MFEEFLTTSETSFSALSKITLANSKGLTPKEAETITFRPNGSTAFYIKRIMFEELGILKVNPNVLLIKGDDQ
jgi:hypothetical protein